ncbi:MAG: hypothetical protein U0T84_12245 [Chitinophagales bacterium]
MLIVRFFKTLLFLLLPGLLWAQPLRQYLQYGNDAFKRGAFYEAATYYQQGLERYEGSLELKYRYAEALRAFNDYEHAASNYKEVLADEDRRQFPAAGFWYGKMLQQQGKYEAAQAQFKKYTLKNSGDTLGVRARKAWASCAWAIAQKELPEPTVVHLGKEVNSEYTEFNPFYLNNRLHFSSLRNIGNSSKPEFLSRVYNDTSSKAVPMPGASAEKHQANAAVCADGMQLFFTECTGAHQPQCAIYRSALQQGVWQPAERLGPAINADGFSATHPHYAALANGERWLFFSSNRPGGEGQFDIWMSRETNGGFTAPVNAGKNINTPDDELTPFYAAKEQQLYFASDGRLGFGGLDIYAARMKGAVADTAINAGKGVNSPANDFYFYQNNDGSKKYFASNRKGSFFIKAATCCNDIWMISTDTQYVPVPTDTLPVAQRPTDSVRHTDTPTLVQRLIDSVAPVADKTYFDSRLQKMRQLLPVTLYFHNDEPECCNLRDTTALNYVTTYEAYWRRLTEYKREFAKGLDEGKKLEAEQAIFVLFTNKVEKGYYDLIRFSRQLWEVLEAGGKVEMTIQGYCSPLNYNQYNIQLGYRRIASLRNYFYQYRNGVFMPFIRSGALVLRNESLGEEKAEKNISDQREDTRNSVYNPAAAKERKVEIISVEMK